MKCYIRFCMILMMLIMASCVMDNTDNNADMTDNAPQNGKITSLQAVIDNAQPNSTIDLSLYKDIQDFNYTANVNQSVTIKNGGLNNAMLTVMSDDVKLTNIQNVNVTASPSLANGSLKISGSSLSSLNIQGGGSNSIYLENGTSVTGQTILNKSVSNNDEFVRLVLDNTVTVQNLVIKQSAILDANAAVGKSNLKNVSFNIDNGAAAAAIAVSPNITFDRDDSLACVSFIDDNSADLMKMFVRKNDESSKIMWDFFEASFERLVRSLDQDTKTAMRMQLDDIIDVTLDRDVSLIIEGLSGSNNQSGNNVPSTTTTTIGYWTIHYDGNGASGSMDDVTVDNDSSAEIASCAFETPSDKKFAGWNASSDGHGESYFVGESVEDLTGDGGKVTLYAMWIALGEYSISYINTKDAINNNPTTFKENDTISISNISAPGYIFDGWYIMSETEVTDVSTDGWDSGEVTHDVVLSAKWTPITYTVRYSIGVGSDTGSIADQPMTYGETIALTQNQFSVTNWVFMGWSRSLQSELGSDVTIDFTDGQNVSNLTTVPNDIVNLYAVWDRAWIVYADLSYSKQNNATTFNPAIGVAVECDEQNRPTKVLCVTTLPSIWTALNVTVNSIGGAISIGNSSWYAPDKDELLSLKDKVAFMDASLSAIDGATTITSSSIYWSSTSNDLTTAWRVNVLSGETEAILKTNTNPVRPMVTITY